MQLSTTLLAQPDLIEDEDKSRNIKIATWILLGITVAVFVARQIMKAIVFRTVALDDFFILAATVIAAGLSITISIIATEGLGVSAPLTIEHANVLMKGYYASEFFYISSISFSKLSLLVLFHTIVAVHRLHRRLMLGFGSFIILWSMASLVAVAFQCELPQPWEMTTSRCFNMRAFWIVYCIIDVSTELSIIMLSVNLVVYLQIRLSRKVAVVACFTPRVLVIAASLVRVVWLYPITLHTNPEYRPWLPSILTQIQVCLSICTACIPYMIPFFKSLEGGLRRTHSLKDLQFRMDERRGHAPSALWFRRQHKSKSRRMQEYVPVSSLQYKRVPQISPQIPTPPTVSPLISPRYHSRPCTAKSRSSSYRGLCINIPDRDSPLPRTAEITSPQTASSFALSPSCASPAPLISMHSFIPSRKAPTPPLKTYSSYPSAASSRHFSRTPSPNSVRKPPRFSLFPQHSSPNNHLSPDLENNSFTPISIPQIQAMQSEMSNGITRHPSILLPTYINQRHKLSQRAMQKPKFSTAPHPTSPPSTTTIPTNKHRHQSVQDLNSPMGAAINHYFDSAILEATTPVSIRPPEPSLTSVPMPTAVQFGAHRQFNKQVMSPGNTLKVQKKSPTSRPESASKYEVLGNDMSLPRDSILLVKNSRSSLMPIVRDTRSSPKLVVYNPA